MDEHGEEEWKSVDAIEAEYLYATGMNGAERILAASQIAQCM